MIALFLAAALVAASPGGTPPRDVNPAPDRKAAARAHFLDARELEAEGRAAEALTEYRAAFRLDGRSRDLCFLLLERLKDANAIDSAAALVPRCLALPGLAEVADYKLSGEVAMRADDGAAALKYYGEARRLAPDDGDVLYMLAGLSEEAGDWPGYASAVRDLLPKLDYPAALMDRLMRAYAMLDSTEALEPVLQEAWERTDRLSYGQALAAWHDLRDRPLSFLETAKRLADRHPTRENRWLLARAYRRADRPDSALQACRALLKEFPGDADLRFFEGSVLFDLGRYSEAHAVAAKLAKQRPEVPPALFLAGASALEARKRGALPWLEKALALAPLSPEYRARLAYADRVLGRPERPLLAYAPTDSLDAEDALFLEGAAHAALAALLEPRESWRRPAVLTDSVAARAARRAALERFARVLHADTANRAALFEVAVQAERLGDLEAAKDFLRRLVRRDSANALILNYLGYILVERPGASTADLAEAAVLLDRAVALEPENGAYLDSKGWMHYRRGELDSARAWLERSLEAMPRDVSVLDHLVEVLRDEGRAEEACAFAARARALDPKRPLARECVRASPGSGTQP